MKGKNIKVKLFSIYWQFKKEPKLSYTQSGLPVCRLGFVGE